MTAKEVLKELEQYGNDQTKKTFLKHGAKEPLFGVKVQDLKKILKQTKKNHVLSIELYATGNSDAMYLAGLMADEKQISKKELNDWVAKAYWSYLSEYAVAWVAAETPHGFELGMKWIKSKKENVAAAGWSTLSNCASIAADEDLDIKEFSKLLDTVAKDVHEAPNRVRYTMNGFVIATGSYIAELTAKAQKVAAKIGQVQVDQGDTACQVPLATQYLAKVIEKGRVGKKRKQARC